MMMTCDQNRITAAVHAWIAGHPMSEGENEFVGMREVAAFVRSLPRRVANDGFAYVTLESNGVRFYSHKGQARHFSGRSICSSDRSSWRTTNLSPCCRLG